jgi:hypothetical protein
MAHDFLAIARLQRWHQSEKLLAQYQAREEIPPHKKSTQPDLAFLARSAARMMKTIGTTNMAG